MKKPLILSFLFILSALLLTQSGCNKDDENDQNPDVTASPYTISGTLKYKQVTSTGVKLVTWPFGPAMLRAIIGEQNVDVAAVQADGNFTILLPGTVTGNHFSDLSDLSIIYGGNLIATPESVKYVNSTHFIVDYTDNNEAKSIAVSQVIYNYDFSVFRNYYYYFYDTEGTFAGKGTAGNTFNWTFTKGWGLVESDMSTDMTYIVSSKSVNAASGNAVWSN